MDKPWEWGVDGLSINPCNNSGIRGTHMDKPWEWGMVGYQGTHQ
jgi:hypothetical protein